MPTPAAALSDVALVARCQAGDAGAWHEFVERFSRYVYAILRAHRLGDADAEDAFQEVFGRAHAHLGRLRDAGAVRPWMAQLTRHAAIDRLRAAREDTVIDVPDPGAPDPLLEQLDLALDVQAAMRRLPEAQREVLDRFFARDQSYERIGAELGLPPGTVASRIARGIARLRLELDDAGS